MATKRRELLAIKTSDFEALTVEGAALPEGSSCFSRADLDEPLFVLRGQDRCAPYAVRAWAHRANEAGHLPREKFDEAMAAAAEMELWQQEHPDRAKFPD